MLEAIIACCLVVGGSFTLIGSIGLARLPDLFTRLHGPTKATTLGVGSILIASLLFFSARGPGLSLHELHTTLFLFLTAPVGASLIAQAARHLRDRDPDD